MTPTRTVTCEQAGCAGSYQDFGERELYCDVCGLAPSVAPDGTISSLPTGLSGAVRGSAEDAGSLGGGAGSAGQSAVESDSVGSGESGSSAYGSSGSRESRSDQLAATPPGWEQPGWGRVESEPSKPSRPSAASRSGVSRRSGSQRRGSGRSESGRSTPSLSRSAPTRAVTVRSSRSSAATTTRGRLGAGLVTVPEVPQPEPRAAVLRDPEVPEHKRYCGRSTCGAPVGRSRGSRRGRTEGFCTQCGQPYSFAPKLRSGDVVRGQYEVAGCLAHGGLGWIYLAVDRAVADRWVVLKGLLDTGDEDALAAAVSERRFLAEIEHSTIVRIYNFVEHLDQHTGSLDGYIVMEYVGGKSLKEIANSRRRPDGRRDPLPVEQACAYGLEALDALAHLHSRNLLYCDFKIDNAIQQQNQLKLIDLGAVRRRDDRHSPVFGTMGYQAPEVAEYGPSVASDLYTVARTLAVLTFDFQGYTHVFADCLPAPEHIEVFRRYESFYRLLVRATDPDPQRRFVSAEEMAEQLTGVLREVVALRTGRPQPSRSTLFGPEPRVVDTELMPDHSGDVSLLGSHPSRLPWHKTWRRSVTGQRALGRSAAEPEPESEPESEPAEGTEPAAATADEAAALPAPRAEQPAGAALAAALRAADATGDGDRGRDTDGDGDGQLPPESSRSATREPDADQPAAGKPTPATVPDLVPLRAREVTLALPVPRIDPGDANAGFLAGLMASAPADMLTALRAAPVDSIERRLRALRALLDLEDSPSSAAAIGLALSELESRYADDWRVVWYRGLAALVSDDRETAALAFDAVYDAFPGEPSVKLALAVCAELLGRVDDATEYYRLVSVTDPSYVSATFGLARVRLAGGDRPGAVAALESVPETSIHYTAARIAAVRARLRQRSPDEPLLPDLRAAASQIEQLGGVSLDPARREQLCTEVLGSALDWVLAGRQDTPARSRPGREPPLLGCPLDEPGLRSGLERSYRLLARLAQSGAERIELVERANRFRPRTWV